ncbi:S9 family peptidase [uncultured bacterium]|nr:S9 family peptidase [uncultured bacterium]
MQGVSPEDLYLFKSVTQPLYKTHQSFFVENSIDRNNNQYLARLASLDAQGHYHVWADGGTNVNPQVSSTTLYYVHTGKKGGQLMKKSLKGGLTKQVPVKGSVSSLLLSGDQLFFKVVTGTEQPKFTTTKFPKVREVTKFQNKFDGYGWLPNHAQYKLCVYDTKDHQVKVLMSSKYNFALQSVSPDQQKVLFMTATKHPKTTYSEANGAFIFDVKTHQVTLLNQTLPDAVFTSAKFSPDGKWVGLVGSDNHAHGATTANFWLYNVASHELKDVTKDQDDVDVGYLGLLTGDFIQQQKGDEFYWLDNDHYLFHAYHHAHSQFYVGDTTGNVSLADNQKRDVYDFSPMDPYHLLICSSEPTSPCELHELDLKTDKETTLYNPNHVYEETHRYVKPTPFTYQSKDGKVTLDGWLMRSPKHLHDKSPVALYVHGGPHAAYGYTFFQEFQALCNHGYSVLYVNPRGSSTYGEKFAANVIGHYGEDDYDDVMSGVDAAFKNFSGLDSHHLYIMGGSYGGFMTLWTIGHTNRFTAAIAQRPVSDWWLMYGVSDCGVEFLQTELGKDLYKDKGALALYHKESPLTYVMNVKTPLMLQHGKYDMRCPISNSEVYYTAMKRNGTEVKFLRYPQSFHGVSRNGLPSLRVHRMHDIFDWLDEHNK